MKTRSLSYALLLPLITIITGSFVEVLAQSVAGQPVESRQSQESNSNNAHSAVPQLIGKRIVFADGRTLEVSEALKKGDEVWFTRNGVTEVTNRKVKTIEDVFRPTKEPKPVKASTEHSAPKASGPPSIWIFLAGGARFRVDEVNETSEGAWYVRGNLSSFIESVRIDRIERELVEPNQSWRKRGWTSGKPLIDQLIRTYGNRFGVDPYLVFLVIEQESQFRSRAVSPKGARGLMQLMPGTARRMGVKDSFDPAQNIMGGSRYLKELLMMFSGRVDLALASYNAGEGAVIKFGRTVPPYKETRNYVKQITKRYGQSEKGNHTNARGATGAQ